MNLNAKIQKSRRGVIKTFVNPFWFGVLLTIIVELIAMIVYAGMKGVRK